MPQTSNRFAERGPAELHSLYVERDGAWVLDVDGVVDRARVDEFRANNIALANQLADHKRRFEGIDPDEARKLAEQQALQAGEVEKVIEGRGLPKSRYDVWMANLGPSEELLRDFQQGRITWAEFGRRYRGELFESGSIDRRNRTIENHGQKFTLRLIQRLARNGPVTVMCHCGEEERRCHTHLLRSILASKV